MKSAYLLLGYLIGTTAFAATLSTQPKIRALPGNPGYVVAHEAISFEFEIENPKRAEKPLLLFPPVSAKSNEECFIVESSREPILPGKKGRIRVLCQASRHGAKPGEVRRIGRQFVVATGSNGPLTVAIQADVLPERDPLNGKLFTAQTDRCEKKRHEDCPPGPRYKRKLCFYSARSFKGRGRDEIKGFCDNTFERIAYDELSDVRNALETIYGGSCDLVDTVMIEQHGLASGGVIDQGARDEPHPTLLQDLGLRDSDRDYGGGQDIRTLLGEGKFECMLTARPRLIFETCYAGMGCNGRLFMLSVAQSLAPNRHLAVVAPNDYSRTGLIYLPRSRTASSNFRDLVLRTEAGKTEWDFIGLKEKLGGTYADPKALSQYCAPECDEALKSIGKSEKKILGHRCEKKDYSALWKIKLSLAKDLLRACVKAGQYNAQTRSYADVQTAEFLKSVDARPEELQSALLSAREFELLLENKDRLCEDPAQIADGNALKHLPIDHPTTRAPSTSGGGTAGKSH